MQTKFIQRYGSKITAKNFLEVVAFNAKDLKLRSLNDISNEYGLDHQIEICKQSINERMNQKGVLFLKELIQLILNKAVDKKELDIHSVKRLLIKDSTSFQLDESLSDVYPGSGGSGSKAAIRFQFEFDYQQRKITDISLHPFNNQDIKNAMGTLNKIEKGDLIIRDLGYISMEFLEAIIDKEAYFLSRLNASTKVYEKRGGEYKPFNFSSVLKEMKKQKLSYMETEVYIGARKLKQRMVIYLLPNDIYQKRLRSRKQIQKKKGHPKEIKKDYKIRAHFNIFITNMSRDQIETEKIWSLYRLRWQIEIIFKIWKSIVSINRVKKVKRDRLEIYLYSRLLLIVLGWNIISTIGHWLYRYENKAISIYKSYKVVIQELEKRGTELLMDIKKMNVFLLKFYKTSRKRNILEKRGDEPSSFEIFLSLGI